MRSSEDADGKREAPAVGIVSTQGNPMVFMRRPLLAFLFVVPALALAASPHRSHPLSASSLDARRVPASAAAFPDTVHVLAVMVQFQKDTEPRTTGDGTFVLAATPADTTLDAPPHDARYFRSHLQFLENYYRRVSKGKIVVRSTLIDSVVTLGAQMVAYSPGRNGTSQPVANLARDAWHAVDSLHLVADFHSFDCFVVFHAGAGHDVDLVSQLGYDPTDEDIPSLYFGLNALRAYYGPSFAGFPVQAGGFLISNSIVAPETESRLLPGVAGDVLLELSINGLLCASMGNFLGLPDLFNTASGASGIGRFGLMDGQAIFSFNGAFPPEPSAWEKYWLGWITPIDVAAGDTTIALPAVALADSIYRVAISSQEYFLIENRSRDPFRTGVTVTSSLGGVTRVQNFTRDVAGFDAYDISGLAGVVTDVTVPDWSLPGATDADGTFYDGGVLIWHIDEAVIANGLAGNSVNANPARRGVDLLEADGSQDIGQSYGLLSPGSGSEQGTPLDFWFQGNPSPVYKNELSGSTLPDSRSNLGAISHISIRNFSARAPHMTAVVQRGDPDVTPLLSFPKIVNVPLSERALTVAPVTAASGTALFLATRGVDFPLGTTNDSLASQPGRLLAWTAQGTPALPGGAPSGLIAQTLLDQDFTAAPAVADINGDGIPEIMLPMRNATASICSLRVYTARDLAPVDGLADLLFSVPLRSPVTVPPVWGDSLLVTGDTHGQVLFINSAGRIVDSLNAFASAPAATSGVSKIARPGAFVITADDGTVRISARATDGSPLGPDRVVHVGHGIAGPAVSGLVGTQEMVAFATTDGYLYLGDNALNFQPGFPVNLGAPVQSPPALADIDGDGERDIVVAAGNKICAFNRTGVSLEGFPVTVRADQPITSAPVVADVDGDGHPDIVVATGDGVVLAVDRHGKTVRGFPLASGRGQQTVAVFDVASMGPMPSAAAPIGLAVASSDDGAVTAWTTGSLTAAGVVRPWPQYQHDAAHRGNDLSPLKLTPVSAVFFPKERAYNWPNPVYQGKTSIRYFVGTDASVKIRIFDLAGDLVTELTGPGVGGLDNEVAWDVSGVQSGVYLARIEAVGGGQTAVQIVKIAVVK